MTFRGSAHFAPSGLAGAEPSFSPSAGVCMVKAMLRPSGDQAMEAGADSSVATRAVWPLAIQRTKIWGEAPGAAAT